MKAIGSYAFLYCDKLGSISIPSFVKTLGTKAFSLEFEDEDGNPLEMSSKSLAGYAYMNIDGTFVRQASAHLGDEHDGGKLKYRVIATMPLEVEVYDHSESFRNIVIPETVEFGGYEFRVTKIGDGAFKNYVKIRTVSMPHIEKIGKEAFYGCTYVKPVDLGSLKTIGVKAFARCSSMDEVVFGDSLATIGNYAFYGCKSISSVSIPDSVTAIGSYAFYKCYGLDDVCFGESLKKIGSRAFAYTSIQDADLHSKVRSVGSYAFYKCSDLKALDMDCASASIGSYAFASCPSLEHVSMPGTISKLGTKAFGGLLFLDAEEQTIKHTAANLSGKTFEGTEGVLVQS